VAVLGVCLSVREDIMYRNRVFRLEKHEKEDSHTKHIEVA